MDVPTQAHRPFCHEYRHTDKDAPFCMTLDKFFTRPLSTQPYQWGGDLPITAVPPSHQSVFDRVGEQPAAQACLEHEIAPPTRRAGEPGQRWNPSSSVPPRSYCAVSHPRSARFPPSRPNRPLPSPWPPACRMGSAQSCLSFSLYVCVPLCSSDLPAFWPRLQSAGLPVPLSRLRIGLVQTAWAEVQPKCSQTNVVQTKISTSCHVLSQKKKCEIQDVSTQQSLYPLEISGWIGPFASVISVRPRALVDLTLQ